MSDYISRKALLDKCHYLPMTHGMCFHGVTACEIELAPAEDVRPVFHAHWMHRGAYGYYCSHCGAKALYKREKDTFGYEQKLTDICPYCFAIMDEVTK